MFHGARALAERGRVLVDPRDGAPPPGTTMICVSGDTGLRGVLDEHVDRLVGELGEEVGGPVVLHALRVRRVEQLLHRDVRHRLDQVDGRADRTRAAAAAPPRRPRPCRRSSTTTPTTGWPRTGSGTKSSGGAVMKASAATDLVGRVGHEVAEEPQQRRPPSRAGYISIPPRTIGPIGCSREGERGDDAEVAAAAAQAPEQVGVLVLGRRRPSGRRRSRPRPRSGCRT